MIKSRLVDWLERNGKLSGAQSGFRKLRSTEDQLLKAVQSFSDGFNSRPPKRTILTLVDFSRAFDRVWHSGLFHKMEEMGIPRCITQWVRAFLSDRRAKVKVDNVLSQSKTFNHQATA